MIALFGMSSPNVTKIVIALEEMGLAWQRNHVAVFRSEQFTPAFMARNPLSKVPVMFDPAGPAGAAPIFESGAILVYLAETYGPQFYPESGPQRWQVLQWLMVQVANIGPVFGQHSHFRLQADAQPYAATRFRKTAARLYRILDDQLADRAYLAGDDYSIADMATYPWARYLKRHGLDESNFPALTAWKQRIAARPAVQKAHASIREWGQLDTADRLAATPDDEARFTWCHFPDPSVTAGGVAAGGVAAAGFAGPPADASDA